MPSYAASKTARLRRITARATQELTEFFAAGHLSLRQYDILSHHDPEMQKSTIARLTRQFEASLLAANTIQDLLDATQPGSQIQLTDVLAAIQDQLNQ